MVQTITIKTKALLAIITLVAIFSCNQNPKQKRLSFGPKVVEAHGYVVPKDSVAKPRVIPAGKPTVIRAGKPKVIFANTNVHPVGIPRIVKAGVPKVCTPGQDGFSFPKTVAAIDRPFMAGIPEVVIAKEASTKDQNPQSFSSFGKLQGLKSNDILCLLEDKSGNLWLGTNGGGASRYDGKSFTNFTDKEGLGQNFVQCILEDKSGNLWFGTQSAGLSKFDGKIFTRFTTKEGLSNNWVTCLHEDESGNLWIGTVGGGVNKYDGNFFTHFTEKHGLNHNDIRSIEEDKSGNIWFGTGGGGLSKYDGKSFTNFTMSEGLSNNFVNSIHEDKSGNIWFGTGGGGLSKYDGKSFTNFTEREGLSNNFIMSILEDKGGNLWFGTRAGGVNKYDGKSFTHFTEKEGFYNNEIWSILEDKGGNLWFGTGGGGLNKYSVNSFSHFTEKEGLSNSNIRCILGDNNGNLWVSTFAGADKYDGKSFTHFTEKEGLVYNVVWTMMEDKAGNIWFGTWGGVSKYDGKTFTNYTEKEGLINNDVKCILEDKKGNIWFGAVNGLSRYDGKNFTNFSEREGLNNNFTVCLSMLEDRSGNLWIGSAGGVCKYDGKTFTRFTEKEGLGHNIVRSILEDKSGNLWFGTGGGGVSKYNGKSFINFTEKEGLADNDVWSMLEDKSGNLWVGTTFGLSKLEENKINSGSKAKVSVASSPNHAGPLFKTYTYQDGFSGIGVNYGKTIYQASDGTIWIGANDRLTTFHPGEETLDTVPPNIQLTGLTLFNENIPWQSLMQFYGREDSGIKDTNIVLSNGVRVHDLRFDSTSRWYGLPEDLSLPYNNNYLTFQFVGITIRSPKKVKYQYKLEGLDENWSGLSERSEATYGNLPHGNYTFKVKAMNGDGYWSKEFKYSFTIRPPWWLTWWAYAIVALLFAGLIYALFRYRLNKIRMQHEIVLQQHKAIELEMQALRAQMNPHFIFNCLSSINHFILQNESETASGYLTKFSRLIRMVLNNSKKTLITLEEELEMLRLYVDLEMLRFKNSFDYNVVFNNPLDVSSIFIPSLVLQPFAENAIWHGLMNKKEQGKLEVAFDHENGLLNCYITDNGVGRKKAEALKSKSAEKQKSMGMQITTERLTLLNEDGDQTICSVEDLVNDEGEPAGTRVTLKIRYKESFEEPG